MGNRRPNWQLEDAEKEQRSKARKEKWEKREKNFWKTFLFTDEGKPKSGLILYTFCLSFVFVAVYIAAFYFAIEWLTPVMKGFPVILSNLLQSLAATAVGLVIGLFLHRVLPDKRLVFGSHIWLAIYTVAVWITMLIILRGTGGIPAFLTFYTWFVLIPLVVALTVTFLLYHKDYVPPTPAPEIPEWKKRIQR